MQFRSCQSLHLVQPRCLVITLLLITASLCLNAQTLHGRVYIAGTETGIANASVYYNASIVGTATNNYGDFTLTPKNDHTPLVISCIGYATLIINEYDATHPLKVYLTPKTQILHDVVIEGSDGMSRKEKEKIFLREFLGTSSFAKGCTITNLKEVVLTYHQKTKTLTAACDTPLQIDNKPLGYHISYFLQEFTFSGANIYLAGNYFYKDNFLPADKNKVSRNREKAYKGSRLQFIRALWANKLKQKGFQLNPIGYVSYNGPSIIQIDSGMRFINLKDLRLFINYKQGPTVLAQTTPTLITNTGYYGAGLEWYGGNMCTQRIGDNLPFEYWPDEDLDEKPKEDISANPSVNENTLPTDTPSFEKALKPSTTSPLSPPPVSTDNKTIPLLFEKTYLHTDRDIYAQGDTLWFKAYLVNAQDNKPVNSSKTLYVELIAPDSAKIIDREIIRLDNGLGNGDFTLVDTLKAGKYRLCAYTNWMRNFGDNFVFEKDITLLNMQEAPVAPDPKAPGNAKNKVKRKTATAAFSPATAITTAPTVRFYPEGGSLVQSISSLVAVKAEDGYGKGIPASGAVLSSAGDTVSRFSCDSLGMGLFALLPIKGLTYRAVVDWADGMPVPPAGGRHDVFQLPAALSKGLTLQIRQTDSVIHVIVNNSDVSGGEITTVANRPAVITMAVKHSGKTLLSGQLSLQGQQTTFKLETAALPEGISAITIYDSQGKPECERLVYVHHPDKKNNIIIHTDKKSYQPQEQVTVALHTQPNANLSMAVVNASVVPEQAGDIISYLQLQSEIKGNIENPHRYFDTTNVNRFKQLDLLLMTQGWRDFIWRRLADTAIRISYAAEDGIPISGRIRDENLNRLLPGLHITLNVPESKGDKIFSSRSDSLGRFRFGEAVFYRKQLIKLSAVNEKGQSRGAFWVDTLLPMPVPRHIIPNNTIKEDSLLSTVEKKRQEQYKISNLKGVTQLKEVNISDHKNRIVLNGGQVFMTWGGIGNETFNITPKDYEYKTLTWYLLHNSTNAVASRSPDIPGVAFKADGKISYPTLVVNNDLLRGIYRSVVFDMPMDRFKRIEIRSIVAGTHIFYLLMLYTKDKGNYLKDNPGFVETSIEGYYQARTFYKPKPGAKPSLNDYRTTIHWEPNIKTDATGNATISFYNTALTGNIRLIVQGVTNNGIPIATSVEYQTN